jgi:hypothetical protein
MPILPHAVSDGVRQLTSGHGRRTMIGMLPAKQNSKPAESVDYDEKTCTDRYDHDPAVQATFDAMATHPALSLASLRAAFAHVVRKK